MNLSLGDLKALEVLFGLLPGLLAYIVSHSLSRREQAHSTTEVLLLGLVYTLVCHACWQLLILANWIPTPPLVGLSGVAICVGLLAAFNRTRGWVYRLARKWSLTSESVWPTIWETTFREAAKAGEYAVVHLADGTEILGAIRGHSPTPDAGHVTVSHFSWLDDDGQSTAVPGLCLIPVSQITMLHFLPDGDSDDQAAGKERRLEITPENSSAKATTTEALQVEKENK